MLHMHDLYTNPFRLFVRKVEKTNISLMQCSNSSLHPSKQVALRFLVCFIHFSRIFLFLHFCKKTALKKFKSIETRQKGLQIILPSDVIIIASVYLFLFPCGATKCTAGSPEEAGDTWHGSLVPTHAKGGRQ